MTNGKPHTTGPRVGDSLVATMEQSTVWRVYQQASLFRQLTLLGLAAYKSVQGDQKWGRKSENHLGEEVSGQVKLRMLELAKGYFYAAQALTSYLPRHQPGVGQDWFPYMVLRNLCLGSMMPLWMQDLVHRNCESLPDAYEKDDVVGVEEIYSRRKARGEPEVIPLPEWGIC